MKQINLISIVQANSLEPNIRKDYYDIFGVKPKKTEIIDLGILIEQFPNDQIQIFNNYFFGYTIPQISKEFDLLRFGMDYTINIEIKSNSTEEKIIKQLTSNNYYLSFLSQRIYTFTFISDSKKLYSIDRNNDLIEINVLELIDLLIDQQVKQINNIDDLFNPTNYLVSPFNSPNEFIQNNYFLTGHQEEIKKEIFDEIATKRSSLISIYGKAGTGKTLLTYDIAKESIEKGKRVLIFHCGNLNSGHLFLQNNYGWEIGPMKFWHKYKLEDYELVIIDESQRIYPNQFDQIIEIITSNNSNCIFSFDKQQCLRKWEIKNNIGERIINLTQPKSFELTEKIRTNKEIANFINALFDKSSALPKINSNNIELNYFTNNVDVRNYIQILGENGWKIINYTPSTVNKYPHDNYLIELEDSTHDVVGQEYDNVIAVIDKYFYYDGKKLATKGYKYQPYYHPTKMLFQIVTRTRKKLNIIIVNNQEILERCIKIINAS